MDHVVHLPLHRGACCPVEYGASVLPRLLQTGAVRPVRSVCPVSPGRWQGDGRPAYTRVVSVKGRDVQIMVPPVRGQAGTLFHFFTSALPHGMGGWRMHVDMPFMQWA